MLCRHNKLQPGPPLPRNLSDFQPPRFLSWLTFHLHHKLVSALYPQAQLEGTAHFWEKRWSDMQRHVKLHLRCVRGPYSYLSFARPTPQGLGVQSFYREEGH